MGGNDLCAMRRGTNQAQKSTKSRGVERMQKKSLPSVEAKGQNLDGKRSVLSPPKMGFGIW